MKSKELKQGQDNLFRSRLGQILNQVYPLFVLANQADWLVFDEKFAALSPGEKGRSGKPTCLIVYDKNKLYSLHAPRWLFMMAAQKVRPTAL